MSYNKPETFGEKNIYGPLLRAADWLITLPLRAINSICRGTSDAIKSTLGWK